MKNAGAGTGTGLWFRYKGTMMIMPIMTIYIVILVTNVVAYVNENISIKRHSQ